MAFDTAQHREYQKKRYRERLAIAKERLGGKCIKCEETEDLEFDHIDPRSKLRKISEATNWSLARFLAEVDKCQLLCREHHIEKGQLNGDLLGGAKVTAEEVQEIRSSDLTLDTLADYYGLARRGIRKIQSRQTWKHVP